MIQLFDQGRAACSRLVSDFRLLSPEHGEERILNRRLGPPLPCHREGGQRLTLKDVKSFLTDEGIAKQFWPERLEILERMPRTPTGKIQKFVLREIAKDLSVRQATGPR